MKLISPIVAAAALAAATAPAFAALGGDAASVQGDGQHMKSAVRVTAASTFAVHEMSSPAGIVVREFVGTDGKVFALSWHGMGNPDLRRVLGSYYVRYEHGAAAAIHSSHRQLVISLP